MDSVGGPLSVLVLLLSGWGKELLVPGFCSAVYVKEQVKRGKFGQIM